MRSGDQRGRNQNHDLMLQHVREKNCSPNSWIGEASAKKRAAPPGEKLACRQRKARPTPLPHRSHGIQSQTGKQAEPRSGLPAPVFGPHERVALRISCRVGPEMEDGKVII